MPRKFIRKYLPSHDSVRAHRYLARFGSYLQHPNLWHLNRRSVAGGFSIGLFAGLVPGPFQMLTAALLTISLRVNLPVALVTTFYTNPFTIGPLYVLAYTIGRTVSGHGGDEFVSPPELDWAHLWTWGEQMLYWALSLGRPLAIGLVVLALALAFIGYFAVQLGWRAYVVLAWRERARARRRRERQL